MILGLTHLLCALLTVNGPYLGPKAMPFIYHNLSPIIKAIGVALTFVHDVISTWNSLDSNFYNC